MIQPKSTGANDTTGNIGTGENGKITIKDVYNNFKKYNFIIKTEDMTIDTSRFDGIAWIPNLTGFTTTPATIGVALQSSKAIILYEVSDAIKNKTKGDGQERDIDDIKEIIIVPELLKSQKVRNIDITVKSKREFLNNQFTTRLTLPGV